MNDSLRRWLLLGVAGLAVAAHADDKPLWEAGFGILPVQSPDYRGSDQSRNYLLPLPYGVYRGEILRADRNGVRGRLIDSDRVRLDISVDAAVPVDSSKNEARQGMPNLNFVFEVGPVLSLCLLPTCDGDWSLQFRWPVRAVFDTDFRSLGSIGGTTQPHLNFDLKDLGPGGGWNFGFAAGPLYASERYHDYYYQVDPAFATATRPAYDARGGYSGLRYTTTLSKRFDKVWFGAFARYDDLAGAIFEDSPLVRIRHSFMAGFALAWVLAESPQHVSVRD